MVLILTNTTDETANYVCDEMDRLKAPYVRLNTDQPDHVSSSYHGGNAFLKIGTRNYQADEIRSVSIEGPSP